MEGYGLLDPNPLSQNAHRPNQAPVLGAVVEQRQGKVNPTKSDRFSLSRYFKPLHKITLGLGLEAHKI